MHCRIRSFTNSVVSQFQPDDFWLLKVNDDHTLYLDSNRYNWLDLIESCTVCHYDWCFFMFIFSIIMMCLWFIIVVTISPSQSNHRINVNKHINTRYAKKNKVVSFLSLTRNTTHTCNTSGNHNTTGTCNITHILSGTHTRSGTHTWDCTSTGNAICMCTPNLTISCSLIIWHLQNSRVCGIHKAHINNMGVLAKLFASACYVLWALSSHSHIVVKLHLSYTVSLWWCYWGWRKLSVHGGTRTTWNMVELVLRIHWEWYVRECCGSVSCVFVNKTRMNMWLEERKCFLVFVLLVAYLLLDVISHFFLLNGNSYEGKE